MEVIKGYVVECCGLPKDFNISDYRFFQSKSAKVLYSGEHLDLGGRKVEVIHTQGHSPGHMCFWEKERGYLFTGDLVYKGTLTAWFPSTDPKAYMKSLERIAALPAKKIFPAHHSLDIRPEIVVLMRDGFRQLEAEGKLHHGSGTFDFDDWSVQL